MGAWVIGTMAVLRGTYLNHMPRTFPLHPSHSPFVVVPVAVELCGRAIGPPYISVVLNDLKCSPRGLRVRVRVAMTLPSEPCPTLLPAIHSPRRYGCRPLVVGGHLTHRCRCRGRGRGEVFGWLLSCIPRRRVVAVVVRRWRRQATQNMSCGR